MTHPAIPPPRLPIDIARMTKSLWTDAPTHIVVHEVMNHIYGMPVRAIETLLSRGDEPVELLRIALQVNLDGGTPELSHWGAVAAGVVGQAGTLPELLAHLPAAAQRRSVGLGFATAEAVVRLGPDTEEEMLAAAAGLPPAQRYWHCYAAALGSSDASLEFLVRQLEENPQLRDISALGLAHRRYAGLPDMMRRMVKRVHAWQRGRVEWALIAYLHELDVFGWCTPDWRLRYRYHPGWGDFPGILPCVAAVVRSIGEYRDIIGVPPVCRSFDEVLSLELEPPSPALCVMCDAPGSNFTGALACRECLPVVTRVQSDGLLAAGGRFATEDIFDALNWLELGHQKLVYGAVPAATPNPPDELQRALLSLDACRWVVEQGFEVTSEGAAAILVAGEEQQNAGRPPLPHPADPAAWR
jgi:hypothetical protein